MSFHAENAKSSSVSSMMIGKKLQNLYRRLRSRY